MWKIGPEMVLGDDKYYRDAEVEREVCVGEDDCVHAGFLVD